MLVRVCSLALLLGSAVSLAQTAAPSAAHPAVAPAAPADKGAPKADDPELPWPADQPIPPAPALTPEEELKTFQLPPGFRAELVAADPQIGEPVTMAWDEKNRLWVVEMRGYMPNVDAIGEDQPNGRITILEDTNGDGRMDKETVFLDQLVMPRAVLLRKGGAVIAEPPALFWCPDDNGDGVADSKTPIHPTYTGGGNPEHMPNGLLPTLDNWIYNSKSNERFRFTQAGEFKKERTIFRGQWGIAQDDWGRLYYNYNSDQLRADLLPGQYLTRNSNFRLAEGGNVQIARDQHVFPIRVTPGANRAYRPGMLKDGKLNEFTGASAPVVYRGDLFPEEFRGNSFVPEPVANLIKRNLHLEKDGEIAARHAYKDTEFMASTDERFRPVGCFNGPDGALYVVDMYRGIIQHVTYVSPWYRRQVQARGLEQPLHQGRIWRIVPEGAPRQAAPPLAGMTGEQLVAELGSANGWRRDTAQRLLVERGDASVVPALQAMATAGASQLGANGRSPLARVHALWTLEGLEKLDAATAIAALADADAKVRAAAVRLCEPFAEKDAAVAGKLFALADDASADVALQLLLTLGELGAKADATMAAVLNRHVENALARSAALTGLKGRELEFLETLLASEAWSHASPARANLLGHLARCVVEERKPERIARLLERVAAPPQVAFHQSDATAQKLALPEAMGRANWQQIAILDGLAGAIPPMLKPSALHSGSPPKPTPQGAYTKGFKVKASEEPAALRRLTASPDPEVQKRALKFAAILTWPGKPGEKEPPKPAPLTDAQKAHIEQGKALYAVCGACHQPNGQGQEGLAPPLAGSDWVTGPESRLIRIALQGVGGPIEVNGKEYSLDMPGLAAALTDEQIAQILSYIRREWGHEASVVETATVTKIRDSTKDRGASWTADELARIP